MHDHTIKLVEGAQSPRIQPYHYPHYQKKEIEKIVKEMLLVGIIKPSNSQYSSPVLLLKRKTKDGIFVLIISLLTG